MIGYLTSMLFLAGVVFVIIPEQGIAMPVRPIGNPLKSWTDQDTYNPIRAALAEPNMHQGKVQTPGR